MFWGLNNSLTQLQIFTLHRKETSTYFQDRRYASQIKKLRSWRSWFVAIRIYGNETFKQFVPLRNGISLRSLFKPYLKTYIYQSLKTKTTILGYNAITKIYEVSHLSSGVFFKANLMFMWKSFKLFCFFPLKSNQSIT